MGGFSNLLRFFLRFIYNIAKTSIASAVTLIKCHNKCQMILQILIQEVGFLAEKTQSEVCVYPIFKFGYTDTSLNIVI